MLVQIVNQFGVRGYLISTVSPIGRMVLVHLHADDGTLVPGYPRPLFGPVGPRDAEVLAHAWAIENGWSPVDAD